MRQDHFFRYRAMPDLHLQEQFSVDPSGNFHAEDYAGRLLWEKNGQTLAVSPEIRLAGGQTAEELTEDQQLWYELELHRLGHLHYSPSFSFSIPRGAEGMQGLDRLHHRRGPVPPGGGSIRLVLRRLLVRLSPPSRALAPLPLRLHPGPGREPLRRSIRPIRSVYAPFNFYP